MKFEELSQEKQAKVLSVLKENGASDEAVLEVYHADQALIDEEMSRIWSTVSCTRGMVFRATFGLPLLLVKTLVRGPCTTSAFLYQDQESKHPLEYQRIMERTLCVLTNKALYIHQGVLTPPQSYLFYSWGIFGRPFDADFASEKHSVIPLRHVALSGHKIYKKVQSKRGFQVRWHDPNFTSPQGKILVYCQDAAEAMTEIKKVRDNPGEYRRTAQVASPVEVKAAESVEIPVANVV